MGVYNKPFRVRGREGRGCVGLDFIGEEQMDRYNQISVSLSQDTIKRVKRVRMFYNQPASTKRVLELFFRVEESSVKTTLGSLSQIL